MTDATQERLWLGGEVYLPLDVVTTTMAILARKGRGKTHTGSVLAEEMIAAGVPVVVVDPTGAWWGLRSSADGLSDGLPVVIFGGDHGDVPIGAGDGSAVARLLVTQRFPAVLDLSLLSKAALRQFAAAFFETLYELNRLAMHLFVDEAHLFAPQRIYADMARLVGAVNDVILLGRKRGIGVTMITQRPATLNKDVLSQIDALIVLGMTGPRDVAAVDEWIGLHAPDPAEARQVKASLAGLPVGAGWLWSPGWLQSLQRLTVRPRLTFDSSATPKVGQALVEPQQWAAVDVAAVAAQLADAAAAPAVAKGRRRPANDLQVGADLAGATAAAALSAKVADLERQLELARSAPPLQVRVLAPDDVAAFRSVVDELLRVEESARKISDRLLHALDAAAAAPPPPPARPVRSARAVATPPASPVAPVPAGGDGAKLGRCARAVLSAVVTHGSLTPVQAAILTRYAPKSGNFGNALGQLRSAGLIDGRQVLAATAAGHAFAAANAEVLPTGRALVDWWVANVPKASGAVLVELCKMWPYPLSKAEVAQRTGYVAGSGNFGNAIGRLRSLQLISGDSAELVATELLGQAYEEA